MNILLPAFALFALTMFVQFRLGAMRYKAVKNGEINPRFYRTYEGFEEPPKLRQYSRHLINLYEAPILFYAIILIAYVTAQSGVLPTALAWLYVASRYVHSYVHLGGNRVPRRFQAFIASLAILITLWVVVLIGLLLS